MTNFTLEHSELGVEPSKKFNLGAHLGASEKTKFIFVNKNNLLFSLFDALPRTTSPSSDIR